MYDLEFDMSENGDRGEGCKGVETHTHTDLCCFLKGL